MRTLTILLTLPALLACDTESGLAPAEPRAQLLGSSEWSEPVNLGAPINSTGREIMPALSADGRSLYFVSDRAGGLGGNDIWVSRRSSVDGPWETPVNVGAPINSAGQEVDPTLSADGRLLFFSSNRPGGHGRLDIYVSRRNPNDDLAWGDPVNLGPRVNTPAGDRGPDHVVVSPGAPAMLYFGRGIGLRQADVYAAPVTEDGDPLAPAELISELSAPGAVTDGPSLRGDAREMFFMSNRSGGFDLWLSTRRSPHDGWSVPDNLGAPVNTSFAEERPELSHDGRTLLFDSDRPDGLGGQDIWISTRTPGGM